MDNQKSVTELLSVRESENYYDLASRQVDLLLKNLGIWLTGIEATGVMTLQSKYIHKTVGQSPRSHPSCSWRASNALRTSLAIGRAKGAAREAVLEAKAAVLKMLQEIEQEQLKSRQRKNDLKIKTELAKAWAEEHAYCSKSKGDNINRREFTGSKWSK